MPLTHRNWEMTAGFSSGCNTKEQGNMWISAHTSACITHPGLCMLPLELPSQPATDVYLEDDRIHSGTSCTRHESTTSDAFNISDAAHNVARQEGQSFGFPDFAKSASKGGLSRENSRCSFWSPYSSTLSVVSEDKPWDSSSSMYDNHLQDERSSLSSLSSSEESSSCSMEDNSEVQSSYKEPLANMYSLEEALPCKRGLSGFFTGKSRSFSCLADVTSVDDLAKPENPYSKRRKYVSACFSNAERLRMHPNRSGAVGIAKKVIHSSKYASALSGVLSAKEGKEDSDCRPPRNLKTPRSYSLSDLQGVGSQFSPD